MLQNDITSCADLEEGWGGVHTPPSPTDGKSRFIKFTSIAKILKIGHGQDPL